MHGAKNKKKKSKFLSTWISELYVKVERPFQEPKPTPEMRRNIWFRAKSINYGLKMVSKVSKVSRKLLSTEL